MEDKDWLLISTNNKLRKLWIQMLKDGFEKKTTMIIRCLINQRLKAIMFDYKEVDILFLIYYLTFLT